jgi:hypothetical protein
MSLPDAITTISLAIFGASVVLGGSALACCSLITGRPIMSAFEAKPQAPETRCRNQDTKEVE